MHANDYNLMLLHILSIEHKHKNIVINNIKTKKNIVKKMYSNFRWVDHLFERSSSKFYIKL